jgi:hypothetical protein
MDTQNVALIIDERSSLPYKAILSTKSISNNELRRRAETISSQLSIKHGFNYSEYYVVIINKTKMPKILK